MRLSWARPIAIMLLALAIMVTSVGCVELLASANAASFAYGWFLRGITMPTITQRECYQNGVLVDCSTLPDGLGR